MRDRTERFHRRQTPHQGSNGHHAPRAQRQQHRDHGGQGLRNCRHGEADGGERHQQRGFAAQHAQAKNERTNAQHHPGQTLTKGGQSLLQGCGAVFAVQQPGNFAQLGVHARGHHQAASPPMGGGGAFKGHVDPIPQSAGARVGQCGGLFGHRDGFAGQGRFIDLELGDVEQAQISRNLVASFQQHNVAGDQGACSHHLQLPIA